MGPDRVVRSKRLSFAARLWAIIGVGAVLGASVALAAAIVMSQRSGPTRFVSRVVSSDARRTCFKATDEPGSKVVTSEFCLDADERHLWQVDTSQIALLPGDCVVMRSAHPTVIVVRRIDCPAT